MRWQEVESDSRARVSAEQHGVGGQVVEAGPVTGKDHMAGTQCRRENTTRKLCVRGRWGSCLAGLEDPVRCLDLFYRQKRRPCLQDIKLSCFRKIFLPVGGKD